MKRYSLYMPKGEMCEHPLGMWVKNNEVQKETTRLRQRVVELEEELDSPVIESEWQELQRKYKERGERMKAIRKAYDKQTGMRGSWKQWFNPETGEPL